MSNSKSGCMDRANKAGNEPHEAGTSFSRSRFSRHVPTTKDSSAQVTPRDPEILAMKRSIYLARAELRNEKLPISKLSAELIRRIFLYVRNDSVDDTFCWLRACTHTCRRFRSIALSSQTLWTRLSNMDCSSRLIKALIARSGNRPTQLHLYLKEASTKQDIVQIALDFELNRVGTLRFVSFESHEDGEPVNWLFSMPMPLLRHMAIKQYSDTDPWQSPTYIPRSLESLHVDRNAFDWTSAIYDNLVELHLEFLNGVPAQPSVDDFQDLLSRMHCLVSLTLDNVTFVDTDPDESCIKLPQSLKDFSILNSLTSVSDSLAYAPHPALSNLSIAGIHADHSKWIEPSDVSNVLKHWNCLWNFQTQISMRLNLFVDRDEQDFRFAVAIYCDTLVPVMKKPPRFSFTQYVDVDFRIDESLEETYALVRSLRLVVCCYKSNKVTDDTWHLLLDKLTGLHSLTLTMSSLASILPCLASVPSYLPNLDNFRVVDGDEGDIDETGWITERDKDVRAHAVWLLHWVSWRRKQGISGPNKLSLPPTLRDELPENVLA